MFEHNLTLIHLDNMGYSYEILFIVQSLNLPVGLTFSYAFYLNL